MASKAIAARRLNVWAASHETTVCNFRVYGRNALQKMMVDILVGQGEVQRQATNRVNTLLAAEPGQHTCTVMCELCLAACVRFDGG